MVLTAEVTSTRRSFHVRASATRKARRPIVGSLTAGTIVRFSNRDACMILRYIQMKFSILFYSICRPTGLAC